MDTGAEDLLVLADRGSSNARVALDAQVVTQGAHDLVDLLGQLTGGGEDQGLKAGI